MKNKESLCSSNLSLPRYLLWLDSYVSTLTRAGSVGKLKNLFGGRLKSPRLALTFTTRFGHPETTHFTMLAVTPAPKPNQAGLDIETTGTIQQRCGLFMSRFSRLSDRKGCVLTRKYNFRGKVSRARWRQFCALYRPHYAWRMNCCYYY